MGALSVTFLWSCLHLRFCQNWIINHTEHSFASIPFQSPFPFKIQIDHAENSSIQGSVLAHDRQKKGVVCIIEREMEKERAKVQSSMDLPKRRWRQRCEHGKVALFNFKDAYFQIELHCSVKFRMLLGSKHLLVAAICNTSMLSWNIICPDHFLPLYNNGPLALVHLAKHYTIRLHNITCFP